MEAYRKITSETNVRNKPVNTIRQKFNADAIRQRRGHVGHDKAKIMRLIQEMDVQEPITTFGSIDEMIYLFDSNIILHYVRQSDLIWRKTPYIRCRF